MNLLRQLVQAAVNSHAHKTALSGVLQNLHMFSLSSPHHRGQDLYPAALRERQNLVHHLIHRLAPDLSPALRAVGNADPGVEKTHIIVDLRDGSHRGSGIAVRGFLVNGNGGRQALNALHIRLLHLSQKLAGIGGKGFHIPALSLRVNGVKGQGRFSGPGKAGENHQLISRDIHGNILQIMLVGTSYFNVLLCHISRYLLSL